MEIKIKIEKKNGETEIIKYGPQKKYDAVHTTQIRLKLNNKTDADILEYLEKSGNKQGTIKKALRKMMEEEK